MTRYAFVGDIHSQVEPLLGVLGYCSKRSITPIFLGDVFNSKTEESDSAGVYHILREAESLLGAVVLRSNHQEVLEKYWLTPKGVRAQPKKAIYRTICEFENSTVREEEVLSWLQSLPYAVSLVCENGKEYRACHAELPGSVPFPRNPKGVYKVYSASDEEKKLMMWGKPYSLPNFQRFWWFKRRSEPWVRVSGHYHKVVVTEDSLVLDGGCGENCRSWGDLREPTLVLFDVERKTLVHFPSLGGKPFLERVML